jgi:hypothetical protein
LIAGRRFRADFVQRLPRRSGAASIGGLAIENRRDQLQVRTESSRAKPVPASALLFSLASGRSA